MISKILASPSGRSSSRRLAFLVVVFGGVLVGVWQGLTDGDVASGVLALFAALLGATGTAVTAGRFAEKGTEVPLEMPEGSEDPIERMRR